MTKILIDPITRIEGHLSIKVNVENGRITEAYCAGEMFRGFEHILRGRDPLDAHQITQRICGVCPVPHGIASVLAQDEAYGITLTDNGRLLRNLISGVNFVQDHILHFYHLTAIDFVDITAVTSYRGQDPALNALKSWIASQIESKVIFPAAPFLPRFDAQYIQNIELNTLALQHYIKAFEIRRIATQMIAAYTGKIPHPVTIVPGGIAEKVTIKNLSFFKNNLEKLSRFVDEAYLPDVIEVAKVFPQYFSLGKGCGNYLAYGIYPQSNAPQSRFFPSGAYINGQLEELDLSQIHEDVLFSKFASASQLHPFDGKTVPDANKENAYSWVKAPRYGERVVEVGPLARLLIAYHKNVPEVTSLVDKTLRQANLQKRHLQSAMGRHLARALETKIIADKCKEWLNGLVPGKPTFADFNIPKTAQGVGLWEAPRGALGHWLKIRDYKIENYQCVVPTTWNCSPRDDNNNPGPVEQALMNTPVQDEKNPVEAARIIRSFDPCLACAVH